MRKVFTVFMVVVSLLCFVGMAVAEDVQLSKMVERVIVKKDKNGQPYVRVLIQDTKEINGISYNKTVSAMCFGDMVPRATKLKRGDKINVIAAKSDFRGGTSYQILKFID